jgi:hypothetical protein
VDRCIRKLDHFCPWSVAQTSLWALKGVIG